MACHNPKMQHARRLLPGFAHVHREEGAAPEEVAPVAEQQLRGDARQSGPGRARGEGGGEAEG
eukprot:7390580-Prymnesium_polylepis.1